MNNVVKPSRGRLALGAALMALLAGGLALPNAASANTNNTECKGSLKLGEKSTDYENPIDYRIACSNYITSYSIIMPGKSISSIETEVFGADATTGEVVAADAFSCNGDLPGFGVNCVGKYGGKFNVLPGKVDIAGNACAGGDAYLVVSYATYNVGADGVTPALSSGLPVVTTSTAGPFNLGKVKGCATATKSSKKKG